MRKLKGLSFGVSDRSWSMVESQLVEVKALNLTVCSESLESDGLRRGGVIAQPFRLWPLKPVSSLLLHNAPNTEQA